MTYEEWCKKNQNLAPLIKRLNSSLPEQYIAFYLSKAFGGEVELQKRFEWLGKMTLDIFVPSLNLAIEYDGSYFHESEQKWGSDAEKDGLCRLNGVVLIRIREGSSITANGLIPYVPSSNTYKNIYEPLYLLKDVIYTCYGIELKFDIDLKRDEEEFAEFVQQQYFQKSVACRWPEALERWDYDLNSETPFDVFYTAQRKEPYILVCPHCGKAYKFHIVHSHERKSIVPCECEINKIDEFICERIKQYKNTGALPTFDDSYQSRLVYDGMVSRAKYPLTQETEIEAEMYEKMGLL